MITDCCPGLIPFKLDRNIYGKFPKISNSNLDSTSYVYYLIKGSSCVYVGFSQNIDDRILSHEIDKDFDSVTVVGFKKKENALDFESREIMRLQPKFNRAVIKGWHTVSSIMRAVNSRYVKIDRDGIIQCAIDLNMNISKYKDEIMIEGSTIKLRDYVRKVK